MSVLDEDFNVSVNYSEAYCTAMATWRETIFEVHKGTEAQYLMDVCPVTTERREALFDLLTTSADVPMEIAIARWVHNRFGCAIYSCSVLPVTEIDENPDEDRYIVVLSNDQPAEYYRLSNILITLSKYKYDQ